MYSTVLRHPLAAMHACLYRPWAHSNPHNCLQSFHSLQMSEVTIQRWSLLLHALSARCYGSCSIATVSACQKPHPQETPTPSQKAP